MRDDTAIGDNALAATALDDVRVHVKLKLSALWASVMFLYLYGDYFGLYVPGKLQHMLGGHGPIGPTSQGSLLAASLLLAAPGLMVFLSLALRRTLSRWLNIAVGVFFSLLVAATMPGAWDFYIALGIVEVALTSHIVWLAWRWPGTAFPPPCSAASRCAPP